MVKFKVPLKDILGRAYYQYELSSSNYNPHIDGTITITCICKNILGNPIPNKELTLMMNGVEQGTSTTNELGIATWSITVGANGLNDFYIGNSHCTVYVGGYRKIYDSNGLLWYVNTSTGISYISLNRSGINISAKGFTTLKSAYSSTDSQVKYCPSTIHMIPTNGYDIFLMVTGLGEIRLYNYNSTSRSNR